jgi:DNA-binding MarR family transcriptional regulator
MMDKNSEAGEERNLDERLARHEQEFGIPAFGGHRQFKNLMLKSLMRHYADVDVDALRIARELGFTQALMMASAEEYLRPSGLSWSKLFILLWLRAMQEAGEKGLNPSELSGHLAVTRNTVSTLLGGLERQGYVTRELDPEDKRRFVIRLTSAGWDAVEKSAEPLFRHLQALFGAMNSEQRIALVHGLVELQQAIVKDRPELAARCTPPATFQDIDE